MMNNQNRFVPFVALCSNFETSEFSLPETHLAPFLRTEPRTRMMTRANFYPFILVALAGSPIT